MIDEQLLTDFRIEKRTPSIEGLAQYVALVRYDGHAVYHRFCATDEFMAEEPTLASKMARESMLDFIKENPYPL